MKRLVLLVAVASSSSGCAMISALARGESASSVVAAGVNDGKWTIEATNEAQKDCEPLKTSKITWAEEKAIGGTIAIAYTQKFKANYFIDGMTEKDAAAMKKKIDAGEKFSLASSNKNALAAYVAVVGQNLAGFSLRPDIRWTFGVLDNPTVNAFSAPGGYVVVTTGLLAIIENEAQLAGILAHEIGHVSNKHALNTYRDAKVAMCEAAMWTKHYKDKSKGQLPSQAQYADKWVDPMVKALSGKGEFQLDSDEFGADMIVWVTDRFIDLYTGGVSKDLEYEADKTALELLLSAGYDSTQFDALLAKLPDMKFSSHPSGKDRIEALNKLRTGDGEYSMWTNGKSKGEAPPAAFKAVPKT